MTSREPRIILYGHFGSGNIGNDSSLESMLHAIKKYQPSAEVICICNGPQVVKERFGIEAMQIGPTHTDEQPSSRLKRIWPRISTEIEFWLKRPRWFQAGDQFIVVGTGAVDDMAVKHPWNAPYELYKWCSVAKIGKAKLVFLSVGVGPILNRISRFLMLTALKKADYRSYRETVAFDYLKSVGYDTTGDLLYPDLVFSLPKESLPVPQKRSASSLVVGLGLINYYGWGYDSVNGERIYQEYISKIKCFLSWLLDKGCKVRIIFGDDVDLRPVQETIDYVMQKKIDRQEKVIVEKISDVNELFAQIAQTDIVVASRFHNVLCSLMLERPVISLGYHDKNHALMKQMGLEAYCQHIETFTFEKLVEQFECYLSDLDHSTQCIQQRQQEYRQLLGEQYRNILLGTDKNGN
jgi:polysaccharide pyruvyl transferase WcaK-like protein